MLTERPVDPLGSVLEGLGLFPADGGLWTNAGHTVGVARCAAGIFIGWIDVGWAAPGTPFSELRDVTHLVERASFGVLASEIAIAVDEAARARTEHLRDCERCDERFVPGQMYGAACCHSCAVRDGDTVA